MSLLWNPGGVLDRGRIQVAEDEMTELWCWEDPVDTEGHRGIHGWLDLTSAARWESAEMRYFYLDLAIGLAWAELTLTFNFFDLKCW